MPRLQADRIPFVLVGRHPGAEVSFVDVDSRGTAQEAVAHLLGHGYRRIAMVCGPPHLIASIDRHAGYVTALQEAAVPPARWEEVSRPRASCRSPDRDKRDGR